MRPPLRIPYLTPERLRAEADAFLDQTHPSRSLPIPVEQMIERLGLDIVPIPGLQQAFDMVGCTNSDMTCIYVDQSVAEFRESRYRFTLAHEIAHVRLHPQIFGNLRHAASTAHEWQAFIRGIPDVLYGSMEWQANVFAGLVLMPPTHLKREYARLAGGIRKMMNDPALAGVPKGQIADMAWDELVTRLAPSFSVSEEVVRRRLDFDGFKPEGL